MGSVVTQLIVAFEFPPPPPFWFALLALTIARRRRTSNETVPKQTVLLDRLATDCPVIAA